MKKTNNILKQFLNLKEDYTLDLSKENEDSQLIVEDDKEENNTEEKDDVEASEKKDTEEKDTEEDEENIKKSSKELYFNPNKIPEIYSKMESAKSPVDVALSLKDFLDTIEKASLDTLAN